MRVESGQTVVVQASINQFMPVYEEPFYCTGIAFASLVPQEAVGGGRHAARMECFKNNVYDNDIHDIICPLSTCDRATGTGRPRGYPAQLTSLQGVRLPMLELRVTR